MVQFQKSWVIIFISAEFTSYKKKKSISQPDVDKIYGGKGDSFPNPRKSLSLSLHKLVTERLTGEKEKGHRNILSAQEHTNMEDNQFEMYTFFIGVMEETTDDFSK